MAVSATLGLVAATARQTTRRRMQRKLERLERQHAIEKERMRIAHDIHDDLGGSLTQITFLGEMAKRDLARPAEAAAHVNKITESARQTVRALETRLGVRLLNRTTRSVAPTDAGERLLAQLRPLLDGFDAAIESVNAFREKPAGHLRLSMPPPVARRTQIWFAAGCAVAQKPPLFTVPLLTVAWKPPVPAGSVTGWLKVKMVCVFAAFGVAAISCGASIPPFLGASAEPASAMVLTWLETAPFVAAGPPGAPVSAVSDE